MMKNRLFSLARDSGGTATIELALAAPILAGMLVSMIDLSTAYSNKLRLEQVAQRTVEKVQQNNFKTSQEAALESEAEAEAGAGSDADLTFWLECNGVRQTGASAYTNGCPDGAMYARYIQVDVQRTYAPLILSYFAGSDGNFTVHGVAGIRIQ